MSAKVMLHLGLGSFHRAHQAAYMQRLVDAGDASWALAGGNLRPDMAETLAALRAQGGAYTLETVTPAGERRYERIDAIRTVVPYDPSLAGLVDIGADAMTRIVSFTVTEAATTSTGRDAWTSASRTWPTTRRRHEGPSRHDDLWRPDGAPARAQPPRTRAKLTLLNCDNLRHNGERFAAGCCSSSSSSTTRRCMPGCWRTRPVRTRWSIASRRARRPTCASACARPPAATTLRR
jgi:D-arabinitol 4-dehydrogenase